MSSHQSIPVRISQRSSAMTTGSQALTTSHLSHHRQANAVLKNLRGGLLLNFNLFQLFICFRNVFFFTMKISCNSAYQIMIYSILLTEADVAITWHHKSERIITRLSRGLNVYILVGWQSNMGRSYDMSAVLTALHLMHTNTHTNIQSLPWYTRSF